MTVYIDPPIWPGHGHLWSHMISDHSYQELHDFAVAREQRGSIVVDGAPGGGARFTVRLPKMPAEVVAAQ